MKTCPKCNRELPDTQAFCELCGTALEAEPTPEQPQKPKRKKWLIPVVAAVAAVAVLIGVLAGGLLTCWYGLGGPLGTLALAAKNTLNAKSMTADLAFDGVILGQDLSAEGNVQLRLNPHREELSLLVDLKCATNDGLDGNNRYQLLVYDGKGYTLTTIDGKTADATEQKADLDEFWERFDEGADLDWEDLIEDSFLESYVDANRVERFVDEVGKKFNDKKWLKNTLGYEKNGGVHRFDFELNDLVEELLDIAEETDLFKNSNISEAINNLELPKTDVVIEYTVKFGRLVGFSLQVGNAENGGISAEMNIQKIGTTKISKNAIDDLRDEVKDWVKDHTCPECGETFTGNSCYYCGGTDDNGIGDNNYGYNDCDACADYCETWEYNGQQLCWDCYSDRIAGAGNGNAGDEGNTELETSFGTCARCGTYTEMWWYGDERLCVDCYYRASHGSGQTDENDTVTEVPDRDAGFRDPDFPIYYN